MKTILFPIFSLLSLSTTAQTDTTSYFQEIKHYQQELNDEYTNAKTSPLLAPRPPKLYRDCLFIPLVRSIG